MNEISGKINRYKLFQFAADVLDSKNLNETYLEKKYLLEGVDTSVLKSIFFIDCADEIRKMFHNSAMLIRNLENLPNDKKNKDLFRSLYDENLKDLQFDSFIESVRAEMQRLLELRGNNYDQLLNHIIKIIASYQNKIIEKHLILLSIDKSIIHLRNNRSQSFLSYAYLDRGLSLALFYYFLQNKAFLYIDWMWQGAVGNGVQLKKDLDSALSKSKQLLFLRTPNSELRYLGGGRYIRQWCAWEIGNFYAKGNSCSKDQNYCRKFFTNLSGNDEKNSVSSNNILLSTFSLMKKVENGIIE